MTLVVLEQAPGEQGGCEPDRGVDEEDPVPADHLRDHAAEQEANRSTGRGDERVDADRLRLFGGLGEHRHDHSEDDRGGHRSADSLQEASPDQHALALRGTAEDRGRNEDRESDQEDRPATDQVAEPSREQEQTAKGDQVGVDDPGKARLIEAEIVLDRGQRHVHDGDVENDHQHPRAEDVERDPPGSVAHRLSAFHPVPASSGLASYARGSFPNTTGDPPKLIGSLYKFDRARSQAGRTSVQPRSGARSARMPAPASRSRRAAPAFVPAPRDPGPASHAG